MNESLKKKALKHSRKHSAFCIALAFLLPLLIFTLAVMASLITPFGKHNLAISDAKFYINGQIALSRLLRGEDSLLYSFKTGPGANNWSSLAWGGFHFGGLLTLFATMESIPMMFTWICGINMSVCGLTMYLLLAGLRGHRLSNLIFSTSYALMGFNVVNCYQTLFFIGPQMLPLMVLGLIWIFRGKTPLLYILSLGLCILFNFYFGFHLCIASVVLYIAFHFVRRTETTDHPKTRFVIYAISSLLSGLLCAFVWLPTLKAYSGGDGRMNQTEWWEFQFSENFPFLQMFSKLFSGANSQNELVNGMPNIFCGILVVALVILFFMNSRIPKRTRRTVGLVLVFYLLTFYITAFTLTMHGFTHTNWFPYRYSYVFSFLLIGIAAEQFCYFSEMTVEETKRAGVGLVIGAILVFSTRYEFITAGTVLLDFAFLLLMWSAFCLNKVSPERAPERLVSIFLLLVVSMNLYANFIVSTRKVREWEKDLEEYEKNISVTGVLVDAINQMDPSFFRMEKDISESQTLGADASLYNYNGIGGSGPALRMFIHKGLNRLGINWFDMRHWYSEGISAATDSLLGLKYLISERDLGAEKDYEDLGAIEEKHMFRNNHTLQVAILSDSAAAALDVGNDPFQNLNAIWKAMPGGQEDIFTEETDITFRLHNATEEQSVTSAELREAVSEREAESLLSESGGSFREDAKEVASYAAYIEYEFIARYDGPVYSFNTSLPESSNGTMGTQSVCLGVYQAGDIVTGRIPLLSVYLTEYQFREICETTAVAYANNGVLNDYAAILNSRDLTLTKEKDHHLTGTFTADADQCLLFTIPWDEGWTCYIDGQAVPIARTWDLFMSVEVPEGTHTYEMRFFPAWMNYGIYISLGALAVLIVFMIVWAVTRKKSAGAAATTAANEEEISKPDSGEEETEKDENTSRSGIENAVVTPGDLSRENTGTEISIASASEISEKAGEPSDGSLAP